MDTATNRVSGWTYDAAGNVTNDGRNTYAYDAENRVISINGGATTYSYDAFGGRIQKVTGGTTVRYYFGLAENTNGAWTKLLISTPAGVIEWDNGTMVYRSNDHLGSPRVMTGPSGTVVGRTDLYPYGEVWSETGTGTKYKMTGKERDAESGNDFFGARYFFNGTGRWLGVDPAFGQMFEPQRLNRYSYALDDPINYVDPDGAESFFTCKWVTVWVNGDPTLRYDCLPTPYNPFGPRRPPRPMNDADYDDFKPCTSSAEDQFVNLRYSGFAAAAADLQIDPTWLLALSAHESAWGKSWLARQYNNLFGQTTTKDDPDGVEWTGPDEDGAIRTYYFKRYANFQEGLNDWVRRWGSKVFGTPSLSEFVRALKAEPRSYNSRDPNWQAKIEEVHATSKKRFAGCTPVPYK